MHNIVQPISDIINVLFVQDEIRFDFMIYGGKTESTDEILDEILSKDNGNYASQIYNININDWNHLINKSAVIFMPHVEYFAHFNRIAKLGGRFYNPL